MEDAGKLALAPGVREARPAQRHRRGRRAWGGYHTAPCLTCADGGFTIGETNLVLYYQNRPRRRRPRLPPPRGGRPMSRAVGVLGGGPWGVALRLRERRAG